MKILRWVPGLKMLAEYKAAYLPNDLAAGLTLGAVMVPVGLAYGEMAGLPLAGLYGSMLPLLAYALFGSSRQIVVGPEELAERSIRLAFGNLRDRVKRDIERGLPAGQGGDDLTYPTVAAAAAALAQR